MTRKVDSTFIYIGGILKVVEGNEWKCYSCYFNGNCGNRVKLLTGECDAEKRTDGKSVLFIDTRTNLIIPT